MTPDQEAELRAVIRRLKADPDWRKTREFVEWITAHQTLVLSEEGSAVCKDEHGLTDEQFAKMCKGQKWR